MPAELQWPIAWLQCYLQRVQYGSIVGFRGGCALVRPAHDLRTSPQLSPRVPHPAARVVMGIMKASHRRPSWFGRLRSLGHERYTLGSGQIIRRRGLFRHDAVDVAGIVGWHVHFEMVFDCVVLCLREGNELLWLDYDNGLLSILRETLPQLEATTP